MAGKSKKPPKAYVRPGARWPEGPFEGFGHDLALRLAVEQLADISELVLAERAKRRWTQEQLALEAGITEGTVWRLENGTAWLDSLSLMRICVAVDHALTVIKRP